MHSAAAVCSLGLPPAGAGRRPQASRICLPSAAPPHTRLTGRGCVVKCFAKGRRGKNAQGRPANSALFVQVQPDGSDLWRLDPVVELIKAGGVGIIPTDSFPAVVCDLENRNAVEQLYAAQQLAPSKLLSIAVRSFKDISTYTLGFAAANAPGQPDGYRLAKQLLPGPYTIILTASKALPKQCINFGSGKSKSRRTVGVRMPNEPVCQALLAQLDRPLLCSSVHLDDEDELSDGTIAQADPAHMLDTYEKRGIDFMVTTGQQAWAMGSTVVDMTAATPVMVRQGAGDASPFLQPSELALG